MPSKTQASPPALEIVAALDLTGCPEGAVLAPLSPPSTEELTCFGDWETPLAPWGGFRVDSGLAVVHEEGRSALEFTDAFGGNARGRAIIAKDLNLRDGRVTAEVKALTTAYRPHHDRTDCSEALVGVVFRVQTSRAYYQFGFEGGRRAVLYRRQDDEWFELAVAPLSDEAGEIICETYVTLQVDLDGDGIRCRCPELDVDFFVTDTAFASGKVGVRALGRARLAELIVGQTSTHRSRDARRRARERVSEAARGAEVPGPVLMHRFDLSEIGGAPTFADFHTAGRYDLLVSGDEGLRALTSEGKVLWESSLPLDSHIVFSKVHDGDHGRLIYGFTGRRESNERSGVRGEVQVQTVADEMVVLRGSDGQLLARRKLPPLPPNMRFVDYAQNSGNFTGTGGFDVVVREWRQDKGGGGVNLWAYDRDLKPLWHHEMTGAHYGHHYSVQFYDVTGDGRDELLAGGTLFDAEGDIVWVHDRDAEMRRILGAGHYDAVALGAFSGDASVDPVAFLLGGSAGVYVLAGHTGRTRAVHRVGHAQGRFVGKVRADLPGLQVLVVTRWGNYGILSLFSGYGDHLWTIQPDYIGQGSCPVTWDNQEEQLIWMNTSGPVQAFYDGYGRRIKKLTVLEDLWAERMRRDVVTRAARIGRDPWDYLTVTVDNVLYAFGPER